MKTASRDDLSRMFYEVVLVLGGVFALHRTEALTVRAAARGLKRAYERAVYQRSYRIRPNQVTPHPEIAELLRLSRPQRARG